MAAKQSNIELIRQLCCRRTLISTEVCEPVSVDLPAYIELRACSFMVNPAKSRLHNHCSQVPK